MEQNWIDASNAQPEEDFTVLIYLDSGYVGLGMYIDGRWDAITAPWDAAHCESSKVLFWRELPRPAWW